MKNSYFLDASKVFRREAGVSRFRGFTSDEPYDSPANY